ncbi:glycosyltransferase family 2 protein [Pelagibacterales bacterium SAG-MED38]|nr:glycosyltransferase family 2 protein [Pelagibacterales bacterium SAG-MED38]
MDLVSVIIPFYKKRKFIKETINSILKQTYENIEIVIIYDDLEKDDLNFLKKNFSYNKKIRIIVNNRNLGAGFSRNIGIAAAKGNYLGFLDADDLWNKKKISKQINYMKKNNLQICHTSYEIINEEGAILSARKSRNFNNYKNILTSCDIGLSSVLLKKELITEETKFANLKTKEDFVLWLKILKSGFEIGALEESLMFYRKTKGSLSSSIFQKLKDGFKVYNYYMDYNVIKSLYLLISLSINYLKK